MDQDDELIDIEGDFELNLGSDPGGSVYDINELPSKSANLQPEYVHHPWVLEQGWSLDPCMDEKSKATIEKMLQEEQHYVTSRSSGTKSSPAKSSTVNVGSSNHQQTNLPPTHKQPWNEAEKAMFVRGLEVYGRRWAKISELIPTRTTLQVKNYGQQYFKVQKRQRMRAPSVVDDLPVRSKSASSILDAVRRDHPSEAFDSVEKILAALGTGQPTVKSTLSKSSSSHQLTTQTKIKCTKEKPSWYSVDLAAKSMPSGSEISHSASMYNEPIILSSKIIGGENSSVSHKWMSNITETNKCILPQLKNTPTTASTFPFLGAETKTHSLPGTETVNEFKPTYLLSSGLNADSHEMIDSKPSEMLHFTIHNGEFVPREHFLEQQLFEGDLIVKTEIEDLSSLDVHDPSDMVVGDTVEICNNIGSTDTQDLGEDLSVKLEPIDYVFGGSDSKLLNELPDPSCHHVSDPEEASDNPDVDFEVAMEYSRVSGDKLPECQSSLECKGEELIVDKGKESIVDKGDESRDVKEEQSRMDEEEESDVDIEVDSDCDSEFLTRCKSSADEIYQKLIMEAAISLPTVCNGGDTTSRNNGGDTTSRNNGGDTTSRNNGEIVCNSDIDCVDVSCSPAKLEDSSVAHDTCVVSSNHITTNSRHESESSAFSTQPSSHDQCSYLDKDSDSECSNSSTLLPQCGVLNSNGEFVSLPAPLKPTIFERDKVIDEERDIHFEFFDGRSLKTLDRYLKIRNYILDTWEKHKPKYVYKTMVRSGLKNCGDVNCIGRIHMYLEQKGSINFGCEQTNYSRLPKLVSNGNSRDDKILQNSHLLQLERLETMRPRKRRVKDEFGHWIPEEELEGKTIEHDEKRTELKKIKLQKSKLNKLSRHKNGQFSVNDFALDPFLLIPCRTFEAEVVAPFQVRISSTALVIMDVHSHISKAEVIGLLGGSFSNETLQVEHAEPCRSLSTGMQCEMDPVSQTQASEMIAGAVSQTQASELIAGAGMTVVGWYHSHPTFEPNPSVRDLETQEKFQSWFSKGGQHFVGVIVNPYKTRQGLPTSDIRCLTVSTSDESTASACRIPYQFSYDVFPNLSVSSLDASSRLESLVKAFSCSMDRVDMFSPVIGTDKSFITKLEESLRKHVSFDDGEVGVNLIQNLKDVFVEHWKPAATPQTQSDQDTDDELTT